MRSRSGAGGGGSVFPFGGGASGPAGRRQKEKRKCVYLFWENLGSERKTQFTVYTKHEGMEKKVYLFWDFGRLELAGWGQALAILASWPGRVFLFFAAGRPMGVRIRPRPGGAVWPCHPPALALRIIKIGRCRKRVPEISEIIQNR